MWLNRWMKSLTGCFVESATRRSESRLWCWLETLFPPQRQTKKCYSFIILPTLCPMVKFGFGDAYPRAHKVKAGNTPMVQHTHHSLSCSAIGLSLQSNAMWSNPIHSIAKNKTLCKTLSIQTFDCDQHKQVYAACRADFPPGWKEESMQNGQTTTPTVLWVSNIVICVDPPG